MTSFGVLEKDGCWESSAEQGEGRQQQAQVGKVQVISLMPLSVK